MLNLNEKDWSLIALETQRSKDHPALNEADIAILRSAQGDKVGSAEILPQVYKDQGPSVRTRLARHLQRLVGQGWLVKTGSTKMARYQVNERQVIPLYLATDSLLRSTKTYRAGWFSAPGAGLSTEASAAMRALSDAVITQGDTLGGIVARRLVIDTAWASSRLEGNTYTLGETELLIEQQKKTEGRSDAETRMIKNHASAASYIIHYARDIPITPHEVRGIHAMLSAGLLADERMEGGIRHQIVEIGKSAYQPEADPHQLDSELSRLCAHVTQMEDPFARSFLLMAGVSYLQPFVDVNKRTGRMIANIALIARGLCPMSYHGMNGDRYISGLLAFYETGSLALLEDAWLDGYRASVERYKSYSRQVEIHGDRLRLLDSPAIASAVRSCVRAVVDERIDLQEQDDYLRKRLAHAFDTASKRDAALALAVHALKEIDPVKGVQLGIPSGTVEQYQDLAQQESGFRPR